MTASCSPSPTMMRLPFGFLVHMRAVLSASVPPERKYISPPEALNMPESVCLADLMLTLSSDACL